MLKEDLFRGFFSGTVNAGVDVSTGNDPWREGMTGLSEGVLYVLHLSDA